MESLLPEDPDRARLTNAGTMELGQTVCTARSPACAVCPIADACAWRAAGYPAYTGPAAPKQKPYAGSDREVRGRILRELRASELPVPAAPGRRALARRGAARTRPRRAPPRRPRRGRGRRLRAAVVVSRRSPFGRMARLRRCHPAETGP